MTGFRMLVLGCLLAGGAQASEPQEFFGKSEPLPVSGPAPGKELPSRFAAKHVTGKYQNPRSTLE